MIAHMQHSESESESESERERERERERQADRPRGRQTHGMIEKVRVVAPAWSGTAGTALAKCDTPR